MSSIIETLKEICSQSQELSLAPALASSTVPKELQVGTLCDKLEKVSTLLIKNSSEVDKHHFHLYYANLLGFIFGTASFCGWITFLNEVKSTKKDTKTNPPSSEEKLLKLLSPGGSFFQVILLLQEDENCIYNLKVEYLPSALINENKKEILPQVSNLFKERIFEIPSEKTASKDWAVRFNAYELYIYSLLTYLLTQSCKNPTSSKGGEKLFFQLVKKTFPFLLPSDSSAYENADYVKYHFKTCSFLPLQKNVSIPVFFMELFSEIWLIPSTKLAKSSNPYYELAYECDQSLPSVAGFNLIKIILNHLCKNSFISLPGVSCETPFNALGASLWRKIFETLQPRLYHFFKTSISRRKIDSDFILLLDVWKSYIVPWGKDLEKDYPLWKTFILYNFFFYKEILLEFSQRCLVAEKISQSLGRTSTLKNLESFYHDIFQAISHEPVLDILREGEFNLQLLPRQSLLHLDFNYDYLPLFPYHGSTQTEDVRQELKDILSRFESSEFNHHPITSSRNDYLLPELYKLFCDLADVQSKHTSCNTKVVKVHDKPSASLNLLHTVKDYCFGFFTKISADDTLIFDKNVYLPIEQYRAITRFMRQSFWPTTPQPCDASQSDPNLISRNSSDSLPSLSKRSFSSIQSSPDVSQSYEYSDMDTAYKRSRVPDHSNSEYSTFNMYSLSDGVHKTLLIKTISTSRY